MSLENATAWSLVDIGMSAYNLRAILVSWTSYISAQILLSLEDGSYDILADDTKKKNLLTRAALFLLSECATARRESGVGFCHHRPTAERTTARTHRAATVILLGKINSSAFSDCLC